MTLLVALGIVVVLALVVAAVVVRAGRKSYAAANEIVPGTTTRAPADWAGGHTPEARLHRRLRDAVAALRANPAMEDAWAMEARVSLEQRALAVDEQLVAVAALPRSVRAARLDAVAAAVDAVEAAVASMADTSAAGEQAGLDRAMAEVAERLALLAQPQPGDNGSEPPRPQRGTA